jgi:hypothetical protein
LYYEPDIRGNEFALIRAIAKCGTAWPWAQHDPQLNHVVWWAGRTGDSSFFAYWDLSNYLSSSRVDALDKTKASWWPSREDTYLQLMRSMACSALSEDTDRGLPADEKPSIADFCTDFLQNDGIWGRGPILHSEEVVEMLLRVDRIEEKENKGTTFCGSPIWVRKVTTPVPGTYYTGETKTVTTHVPGANAQVDETYAMADWNGEVWMNPRWGPIYSFYNPIIPDVLPDLPDSGFVPYLSDITSLEKTN